MGRDLLVAARVVESPLLAAVNTADRQAMWLVEVCNRPVMLNFAVLHDETVAGPVAVDWQLDPSA
jgi:hypothetical protein